MNLSPSTQNGWPVFNFEFFEATPICDTSYHFFHVYIANFAIGVTTAKISQVVNIKFGCVKNVSSTPQRLNSIL